MGTQSSVSKETGVTWGLCAVAESSCTWARHKAVCAQGPGPTCLDEHSSPPLPRLLAVLVSPPAALDAAGTLLQHLGTPALQELQLGEGASTEVLGLSPRP